MIKTLNTQTERYDHEYFVNRSTISDLDQVMVAIDLLLNLTLRSLGEE